MGKSSRKTSKKKAIYPKMGDITQKWVYLLIPFTGNYGGKFSEAELARLTRIPQQTASRYLNELAEQNLLDYERQGRNKLFYFDYSKASTRAVLEILENHKTLVFQMKVNKISFIVSELLRHSESAIVFGSYSSYTYGKPSDLDIILLGKCSKEGIEGIKQKQIIQINEHCISYEEFAGTLKSKNPLAIEILKNHIIFGNVSRIVGIFTEATS